MLYGILPDERVASLLSSRGWSDIELGVLTKQVKSGFNVTMTSSTGRLLDAASALLGCCRERTYDGEPAMKLEAAAAGGTPEPWELSFVTRDGREQARSPALMQEAGDRLFAFPPGNRQVVRDIAASFQFNLARGIAQLAIHAAERDGMKTVALSGGVASNYALRETIRAELGAAGLICQINADYPPGDGCVSFGQCVYAGTLIKSRK